MTKKQLNEHVKTWAMEIGPRPAQGYLMIANISEVMARGLARGNYSHTVSPIIEQTVLEVIHKYRTGRIAG